MTFCKCGQPATHTVRWSHLAQRCEARPSPAPTRCETCARQVADELTRQRAEEYERELNQRASLRCFRSDCPVPKTWRDALYDRARRPKYKPYVNPGGTVRVRMDSAGYVWVDITKPEEAPASWTHENVLYILRQLAGVPVVFEEVEPAESLSWHTRHEHLAQWNAMLPVLSGTAPKKSTGRRRARSFWSPRPPTPHSASED